VNRLVHLYVPLVFVITFCPEIAAATVTFFDASQVATLVTEGTTWDKVRSSGYYFTYTRDKLFTGGLGGDPIGRPVRIPWPEGVEAQAVTAGPNPGKAKITIERVDGDLFDISAFSARLLGNTYGAGGEFEVVPFLNGEEILPDPVKFNATGFYGQTFSYNTTPNPWGQSTLPLQGYDKYTIDLYVDFAWTALTLIGAPVLGTPADYNGDGFVGAADYVIWRNNEGIGRTLLNQNPAAVTPNLVDDEDYDFWVANFGTSGSAAASAIPEPSAWLLAAVYAAIVALPVRLFSKRERRLAQMPPNICGFRSAA
jgi:hypothetical protein